MATRRASGVQVAAVGSRIRGWRRQRGLTLEACAEAAGLSKSYLSKIEAGLKSPSIATVMKVSASLGVTVGALFGEKIEEADIHVFRAAENQTLAHGDEVGATYIPLSQEMQFTNIEAFLYFPSPRYDSENRASHSGEEMIYVVEGSAELSFPGRLIRIAKGDFVQFKGYITHQIKRLQDNTSLLIFINRA